MAGTERQKRDRMAQELFHLLVVVHMFHYFNICGATVESQGQAFIQTDNELRYMVNGMPSHIIPGENLQDLNFHDGSLLPAPVRFDPPMLDFGEQSVGMPHMEQVTVHNPDTTNSLHLLSISGSTLHFHCSFFLDKNVPPGGNTTFEVVFLARQVGNVENTLYIHTSSGPFKYQVFGVGVPNPYRIRPFIGAKVPVNSSFSPLIHMHNPHSSTLLVEEIYTSGGDLHLELPTGEREASRDLWEIPPFETKPIMKANFMGRNENNHTAFIRIKTNKERKDEVLILPVEVEVTTAPGIFSPLEMLDFGILRTLDDPKTLRLNLLNSGSKSVHITNITVSPPNGAINIDFRPVKLKPDILLPTSTALISFTASNAVHPKQWSGNIIVKSKGGQYRLAIPYQVSVLHGSLVYDREKAMFYTGLPMYPNVTRELPITNTFNFTVVVHNISLPREARQHISILNFTKPIFIGAQQTLSLCKLKFHPNGSHVHFTAHLYIHSNASLFNIPVYVYNGRLKVVHHRPEIFKGQLDFGTMGMEEHRSMTFTLRNDNPVDVLIKEYGANMDQTVVTLLGIEKGNGTTLTKIHNTSEIDTNPLVLKPYHYAVFSLNLKAPNWEGAFAAEVVIITQFENLYIPITLRTAEGSLTAVPEKVVLDRCFPGKISYRELRIHSSFSHYMEVRDITFNPNDTRFYYVPPKERPLVLSPGEDNYIGRLFFDPKHECWDDCYVGLPTYIPAGHHWLLGATMDREVADTDQYLYTRLKHKWNWYGFLQSTTVNVTIQLDTNQVRGFLFPAQAHLHWPSIAKKSKIKFPLTQIGNSTVSEFVIENPGDVPVLVQLLPLSLYPNPQTILDMVGDSLSTDLSDSYVEIDDKDIFSLQDLEIYNTSPSNTVTDQRKAIENTLGVKPHKQSIALLLPGGRTMRVRVGFQPKDDLARTSLILIRNNLTIIDTVVVQGQGGRGEMKFSSRKAGSQLPLQFDMTEKHLKNCDSNSYTHDGESWSSLMHDLYKTQMGFLGKRQSKSIPPNFTVRRSFTAKNTGQLPFYIHGFNINSSPCEGYGFKVLDCYGFELPPNTTRKIDIAFTPDFTMSRIRRTLSIYTSLGPALNYSLQATVPAHMLGKCAAALPRPSWEPILYYSTVSIMTFLLFCILVAAYFEADRIIAPDISKHRSKVSSATQTFDKGKVFDLKTIAGAKSPEVPRPSVIKSQQSELANGHVDPPSCDVHPTKKKASKFGLRSIFSKLFKRSPSESAKNGIATCAEDPQAFEDKGHDTNIVCNSSHKQISAARHNTDDSEKVSLLDRLACRKSKAPRGPYSDTSENTSLSNGTCLSEKKQGNTNQYIMKDTPSSRSNRTPEQENKVPVSDKTFTDAKSKTAYQKKTEKTNNYVPLENLGPMSVTLLDEDADDEEPVSQRDHKKGRQRKSKAESRKEEKERRQKEKQVKDKQVLIELEQEETSSTTTESSGFEPDDKNSSARDSTPEPLLPKAKKLKTKYKKTKLGNSDGVVMNDEEFTLASNSKAHPRIKVDQKNSFGGNILRPSTLELPYTTELEAKTSKDKEPMSAHTIAALTADKNVKKAPKPQRKSKGEVRRSPAVPEAVGSDASSDRSKESPPPAWDIPAQPGELGDLAQQTELFAKARQLTGPTEPVSSSNRSSSYSSVVSSGSNCSNDSTPKMTLRGTAAEVVKRGLAITNSPDLKRPGPIGSKTPSKSPPPATSRKNPWNISPGGSASAEAMNSNSFGLNPIAENKSNSVEEGTSYPPTSMFLQDGLGQFGFGTAAYEQPVTMMQTLQAERRRRLIEYQQKRMNGEDWPGFELTKMPQESLWDTTAPLSETWSNITDSPPKARACAALWEPPVNASSSSSWTPVSTVWSAGNGASSILHNSPASGAAGLHTATNSAGAASAPAVASFDPFNTLGNIWNPTVANQEIKNWGFPPKPEDAEE